MTRIKVNEHNLHLNALIVDPCSPKRPYTRVLFNFRGNSSIEIYTIDQAEPKATQKLFELLFHVFQALDKNEPVFDISDIINQLQKLDDYYDVSVLCNKQDAQTYKQHQLSGFYIKTPISTSYPYIHTYTFLDTSKYDMSNNNLEKKGYFVTEHIFQGVTRKVLRIAVRTAQPLPEGLSKDLQVGVDNLFKDAYKKGSISTLSLHIFYLEVIPKQLKASIKVDYAKKPVTEERQKLTV